jgi:1-acyl-sn-glycerol-3-phosphate acyltransferase
VSAGVFTFCNNAFKLTLKLFSDLQVEGRENIPKHGPVIFIANHVSNLDPPIVASVTGRNPGFLAKQELFERKIFSMFLNAYGAHPLKRGSHDIGALRWGSRRLKQKDGALILFPEGTRDKTGAGMKQGLPGVTQMALMTGAPIIPIAITGAEPLQNVLKVFIPRAKLRIKIGKPVLVTSGESKRLGREQVEAVTTEIMLRVARLLPESYRGYYQELVDTPSIYTKDLDAAELANAMPAAT